jgi:hypothetical protein
MGSDHNQGLARAYMMNGESTIPTGQGLNTVKVKTRAEGRTLVVEGTDPGTTPRETLSLSADGQTLTITIVAGPPEAAKTTTLVYAKVLAESPCTSWPTPCRN